MPDITIRRPKMPSKDATKNKIVKRNNETERSRSLDDVLRKYKPAAKVSRLIGLSDATGSMASVWSGTRRLLTEMFKRIAELGEFEMKWVAYRDYCDGNGLIEQSRWEYKIDPLLAFVRSIECYGGGDWEEAVEKGLELAANDNNATRVLLIGDAPPHPNSDYSHQAKRLGQANRPVYSFVVGKNTETFRVFSEISQLSGGACCYLENVDDLLDVVVIAAAHDLGGESLVLEYTKKYEKRLSASGKAFSEKLFLPEKS